MKITDFEVGDNLVVTGFVAGDSVYRSKLMAMGLIKRAEFTLVRVAPLGDPVEIKLKIGGSVSLRKDEAQSIDVEKV